jgi:tetratricopeptide (TPR) repeat protein
MPAPDELALREKAAERSPQDANARYLFGAELAQSGHYERAVTEIKAAVQLQPTLYTAHLQLGLLLLTLARPSEAVAAWQPLDGLEERAALRLFKRGLEALIRDDFELCMQLLTAGIAANTTNPALNRDMGLVIARARDALMRNNRTQSQQTPAAGDGAVRTDFSLYDQ